MARLRSSPAVAAFAALSSLASLASATKYSVHVGKGGQLKFDPETLTAQVGDEITYQFFARNHSVTQSSFAEPCKPQSGGFFSGFTPSPSADVTAPTTFTITVNDTNPIWIYCGQTNGDHCQNGMIHAINAPAEGNTFDKYKSNAASAQKPSISPPDGLPVGGLRKLHIDVGFDGNLVFNPSNVTELVGTLVEFGFNQANHYVVQSSFDDPCHPLKDGFSAPFVPTQQSPSGVTFEVEVTDTKPVWFYCAQTAKTHCQSGMVGSINAPPSGDKTYDAFKQLATNASPSTIQPEQPNVGTLKINGTAINYINGVVLNVTAALGPNMAEYIPPPGYEYSPYMVGMAGGAQPANYDWGPSVSDEAVEFLQALQYVDNFILSVLSHGYSKLSEGEWKNANTVGEWLQTSLTAITLSIGVVIDVLSLVTDKDHWMVPALATALGAKSRMTAVINMMQGHLAATAPREVLIPYQLAWSYISNKYVQAGSCSDEFGKSYPAMNITNKVMQPGSGRTDRITVGIPAGSSGKHYMAWVGPWGTLKYSDVTSEGATTVPEELSGHAWAVLTTETGLKAHDIEKAAATGPEMVWVADPWA
ncbi:Cupredoxin [Pseudomassariella vexata]|uniref:Cupredoxin n=1 Tax=Pseudomassariella vexata TaxID=1141098 RepID=A0A1Y2DG21_9PEZI|nr:Cupredoxin [Pseudomassariella vexata]ORY58243.1 Cupredoxin [Pseudomassariella vexata]